ncbi:MAG: tRNA epoxyqueuosine(34) reductase QueG [Acidimicrobiales bacterium]
MHLPAPSGGVEAWGAVDVEPGGDGTALARLADELVAAGREAGLAAVGITDADVFADTLRDLLDRKRHGLNGDMQFTYRNPQRSTDPARMLTGARSLVVGAWGYRHADASRPPESTTSLRPSTPVARVARYARADHYLLLRRALGVVAGRLQLEGWRAVVVCDDNALVDRAAAHRAGLGWFGKNSLLLLPGLGSWYVLGSVVTDAPLSVRHGAGGSAPTAVPAAHGSGCGSCSRCMTACPTGALVSPGILDARRCLAWLVQAPGSFPPEYRDALGNRIYGCDDCQVVCPVNRMADRRDPVAVSGATPDATPDATHGATPDAVAEIDLIELLDSSDGELLERHGRWYIPDRDPRYLRRNALVALGNAGDGNDRDTERVLCAALGSPDAMIVEHARWAARKLGRDDLVKLLS